MNTPRVVMQETKKAFRAIDKRKDLEGAVNALSNLKGVGPAMASGNHQRPSSKCSKKGRIDNHHTFDFFHHFFAIELVLQPPPPVALLTINDCGDSSSGRCSFVLFSFQFSSHVWLFLWSRYFTCCSGASFTHSWPTLSASTPPGRCRLSQGRPSGSFLT